MISDLTNAIRVIYDSPLSAIGEIECRHFINIQHELNTRPSL